MQLGVGGDVGLPVEQGLRGVDPGGQQEPGHLAGACPDQGRVVLHGQGVQVGDERDGGLLVLAADRV